MRLSYTEEAIVEDRVKPDEPPATEQSVVEALLAKVPWPEGDAGLDDETLAAWVEGALSEPEQDAVEARLAEWPQGRAWMAEVRASRETAEPAPQEAASPPSVFRQTAWMPIAAAAMLLVAFGIAKFMGGFEGTGETPESPALADTVAQLQAEHDELFGDFSVLSDAFLARRREAERGGLVARRPSHVLRNPKPTFVWTQRDGIEQFHVTLYDSEGRTIWQREARGTTLEWPTEKLLEPGTSYVWEVSGDAGLGEQTARRKFETISEADWRTYRLAGMEILNSKATPLQQDVLIAHFAIRMGLLQEAEQRLRQRTPDGQVDPLTQKTLDYLANQ